MILTLEEAIAHAKEAAETNTGQSAEEHLQLAEWLEELRLYRELYGNCEKGVGDTRESPNS